MVTKVVEPAPETRIPERFEKHNGHWWIMGVEPFSVNGVLHYAMGSYEDKREAREDWLGICRTMREMGNELEYGKKLFPVPANYSPVEDRIGKREPQRRRRRRKQGKAEE